MSQDQIQLAQLQHRVQNLRNMVRQLQDIEDIQNLRFHYHSVLNDGRWRENFDNCTDDVICRWGHEIPAQYGKAAVRASSEKVMASGIAPTIRQFIHAHLIDIQEDSATATSYMEAYPIQFGKSVIVAARWADKYVRIEGRWWIKEQFLDFSYQVRLDEGWAQKERVINPFESLDMKSNR